MALKDVGKEEIRNAPNVLKSFHAILTSTDANVQTFVLRTLGFLAIRNDEFKVWKMSLLMHWFLFRTLFMGFSMYICSLLLSWASWNTKWTNIWRFFFFHSYITITIRTYFVFTRQDRILNTPILEHLVVALQSGNQDLTYWAVVLLHDLAMCGDNASAKLLNQDGLVQALVHVVKKNSQPNRKKEVGCCIHYMYFF